LLRRDVPVMMAAVSGLLWLLMAGRRRVGRAEGALLLAAA